MAFKTYKDSLESAVLFLENKQDDNIDLNAPEYLMLEKMHWKVTDFLIHQNDNVTPAFERWFNDAINKIANYYPAQYIMGEAWFYDRVFKVNESVLIPRPETEWIVDEILKNEKNHKQNVVDIGSGSGCIGITLKKECPLFKVTALDISREALALTHENACRLKADIVCQESDVLNQYQGEKIDILVSNPPYIALEEQDVMDESVKRYEPDIALYAKDRGLDIYKQIANQSQLLLSETGRIYLEIGYHQGEAVKSIFESAFPNKIVSVKKDLSGNDRLVIVGGENHENNHL